MQKRVIFILICLLFFFCRYGFTQGLKDCLINTNDVPSNWRFVKENYYKGDPKKILLTECRIYIMQETLFNSDFIDTYYQIFEAESREYSNGKAFVDIEVFRFSSVEGAKKVFKDGITPLYGKHTIGYLDLCDEGFRTELGAAGRYAGYFYREGLLIFDICSDEQALIKEAFDILHGKREKTKANPEGTGSVERKSESGSSNKPGPISPAGKVAMVIAGAAALAGLIYGLLKLLNAGSYLAEKVAIKAPPSLPSGGLPKITIKKPEGPAIKIKKPPEQPQKKDEEKKEKRRLEEIALQAKPHEVIADGKSTAVITVYAADNERHPAPGEGIELWFENYDGSKIEPPAVITNAIGEASAKFTAGKIAGEQNLSAQARSNPNVRASVKIKLKEEVYYEARDSWSGIRVRVNIPNKRLNKITPVDVLRSRVLDNFDNEIKTGFGIEIFSLAAFVGSYGISSGAVYARETQKWKNIYSRCTRLVNELETALEIGLGVGLMSFTNFIVLMIAEEIGEKTIPLASKILSKITDKLDEIIGLEKQAQIYELIQKEKDYMKQMTYLAGELADFWGQVNNTGGDHNAADKLIFGGREAQFYELNSKILALAINKGKISGALTQADLDAIGKDIENINRIILETKQKAREMEALMKKIQSAFG